MVQVWVIIPIAKIHFQGLMPNSKKYWPFSQKMAVLGHTLPIFLVTITVSVTVTVTWFRSCKYSCKLAAKAVAGISVLRLIWLSCQGVPIVGAPPCS